MHALIKKRATGTPASFAKKLGICKSMLMINLSELKELGAPVKYDLANQTYYYTEPCELLFKFELQQEDFGTIKGGEHFNICQMLESNDIRTDFGMFVLQCFES